MARMVPAIEATVHVYNALIAACDREGLWDKAMQLHTHMRREGITPNQARASWHMQCFCGWSCCAQVQHSEVI